MSYSFFKVSCCAFTLSATVTLACSNVFITGPEGVAAVGRNMDLSLSTGNQFALGRIGDHNASNINMPQQGPARPLHWTTKYAFFGQDAFGTSTIADGVNSQGLYAGILDLPGLADYPAYDPQDKRPELSIVDVPNYVLGTAADVPQALSNLQKAQFVNGALQITNSEHPFFASTPAHISLRDKAGNSAVIEMIKGPDGQPELDIYFHKGGTTTTQETIYSPGKQNPKTRTFSHTMGAVLTNSPAYSWHLQQTAQYNNVFTGSTDRKWDDLYMNGSGMYGIPGDWTPPSRFVRASQLIRLMPKASNESQALFLARQALQTVVVPLGSNPEATEWSSLIDLQHSIYYFQWLFIPYPSDAGKVQTARLNANNNVWKKYSLSDYANLTTLPHGWRSARVVPGAKVGPKAAEKVMQMIDAPTPGNVKYHIRLT